MDIKYDLEMVIPVSSKYRNRLEDFKKYGVVNVRDAKVLLTLICSGEEIEGLDKGWPEDISIREIKNECREYAANTYRYFLEIVPESRWIMKIDDDSCTDVNGLLENLDRFYDSEENFYLAASISRYENCAGCGPENQHRSLYHQTLGSVFTKLQHEMECCVLSHSAIKRILSCKNSVDFLHERCSLQGGATDVALAFASSLCKLYPIDLPFASHLPAIDQFSLFGGHLNHIHLVSRDRAGDNFNEFDRCGPVQYEALVQKVEGVFSENEKHLIGKKFIMETEHELRLLEFRDDRTARIKFDHRTHVWVESEGRIHLFCDPREIQLSLRIETSGVLSGIDNEGRELMFQPVGKNTVA